MINKKMLYEELYIKEYDKHLKLTNKETDHFTKYMNLYSCNHKYGDLEIKGECIIKLKEYQRLVQYFENDYFGHFKNLELYDDDFIKLEFMIELNNDIDQKDDYIIEHKLVTPLRYKLYTFEKDEIAKMIIKSNVKTNYQCYEVQEFIIDMFNEEKPVDIKLI